MHTPTSNIDPGPGYRLLEFGEIFIEGDQAWTGVCWTDRHGSIGCTHSKGYDPTRRKLPVPDYRWIPVGEAKPPTYVTVLATNKPISNPGYKSIWLTYLSENSGWVDQEGPGHAGDPTHWCPLPPALPAQTREGRQVEKFKELAGHSLTASDSLVLAQLAKAFKEALTVQ